MPKLCNLRICGGSRNEKSAKDQNCTSEGAALTLRQLLGAPCPKMLELGRVSSEMKVEVFSSKYLLIVFTPGFNQRGSDVPLALLEMLQTLSWLRTPPNQVPILRTSFRSFLSDPSPIIVYPCDMNSTLEFVVPLAMFGYCLAHN